MKIIVIAESIDVNDSSGSKANVALIKNLHRAGFELKVYHYTRKKLVLDDIPCVEIPENRKSLLFFLSRLERYTRYYTKLRLNRPLEKIFGFSFTLFNDRNSIIDYFRKEKDFRADLIITLSKGGSFRPHHALLGMPEWHARWISYMHDPYPMHHYPKPYTWNEPGFEKKEKFIREISEKATFSAFPSELLKQWMGSFYPNFLKTGFVIPHQLFEYDKSEIDFPDYFDPTNFNLLHAGNLLGARNPATLLKAFQKFLELVPESKKNSRLIFLGGNNKRVHQMSKKSDNIYVSNKYVEFDKVYKMQKSTSVNIILEAKSEISPFLPGKFPHCVSADKPILLLGPEVSESHRLLGENYPYWSEIDDLERITFILIDLYKKWNTSKGNLKLNRPDLEQYCGVKNLKAVMNKIVESP